MFHLEAGIKHFVRNCKQRAKGRVFFFPGDLLCKVSALDLTFKNKGLKICEICAWIITQAVNNLYHVFSNLYPLSIFHDLVVSCCVYFYSIHYLSVCLARACAHSFSARVFLRAINTYAETMNQKFLNNDKFEEQVGPLFFFLPSFLCYNLNRWPSSFNSSFCRSSLSSYGTTTSTWRWRSSPRSLCSFRISPRPRGTRSWPSERRAIKFTYLHTSCPQPLMRLSVICALSAVSLPAVY